MAAHFGWHGLLLQHPDDWAPVALSGDRSSGYARLASPRSISLQVRWAPLGKESLAHALNRYLDRLSRDSRRAKHAFSREIEGDSGVLRYRYRSDLDGDGLLFPTADGRVAFLETVGDSPTSRKKSLDRARDSFASGQTPERWSVLGLDFTVPGPLRVESKEFLAGRTTLKLTGKGVRVVAERWGLAESLLARTTLAEWLEGRLGRGWSLEAEDGGIRSSRKAFWGFETALAVDQPDRNQITLLRVKSRAERWRPTWDWLI